MQQLIEYSTVDAMVEAYEQSTTEVREAFELLERAQTRLTAAFHDAWRFRVNDRNHVHHDVGKAAADESLHKIHKAAVQAIITKLGIRPTLSEKRWLDLQKQISDGKDLPPITADGIRAMVEGIAGNLSTYFNEAVDEVFEFLRPRGWTRDYKTNSQFEIGRRVILHCLESSYGPGKFRPSYYSQQNLTALDNVFHFLDGKKRPEGSHYGKLGEAIIASKDGKGETEYFRFKCFQNGNLHLEFKRLDLLRALNTTAGGNRLRQPSAA